jgi:hypothetical protein
VDQRESWLASSLLALADSLRTRQPAYLDILTGRLAELVAPAEVGLLVTAETGALATPAASSQSMHELLDLEMRYAEGPCTTCHGTGRRLPRLGLGQIDDRWPRFGPQAREAGFGWVSALPICRSAQRLGAVTILDAGLEPAVEPRLDLVDALVEAAAIGLVQQQLHRQSLRRTEQLQHALDSRVVIEQAKGVTAARRGVTPDAAFDVLRRYARHHGRRLRDVADDVIAGRLDVLELSEPPRAGTSGRG